MILSFAQVRDLAASVGFPDPSLMAAIAMAESGGNTSIVNDTRGLTDDQIRAKFGLAPGTPVQQEWSIGLWQINALAGGVDAGRLTDATYNAQVAYERSDGGTNLNPWWLTVSRGAYKQYLPRGYVPGSFPAVTPPAQRGGGGSAALAVLGALALTVVAGTTVHLVRSRREAAFAPTLPPDPEPWGGARL